VQALAGRATDTVRLKDQMLYPAGTIQNGLRYNHVKIKQKAPKDHTEHDMNVSINSAKMGDPNSSFANSKWKGKFPRNFLKFA
jgi:hypothetical protein